MAWTSWRKVADKVYWYTDHALRLPVCYELGLAAPRALDALRPVYLGAAMSEQRALLALEAGEAPLAARVHAELARGQELYIRCQGAPSLEAARGLQAAALNVAAPAWNAEASAEEAGEGSG